MQRLHRGREGKFQNRKKQTTQRSGHNTRLVETTQHIFQYRVEYQDTPRRETAVIKRVWSQRRQLRTKTDSRQKTRNGALLQQFHSQN